MELVGRAWNALAAAGELVRLFNAPAKVLRRQALLRKLNQDGLNPFAVWGVDEDLARVRFPAFLRRTNEHDGSLSPLLQSESELSEAIMEASTRNVPRQDMLVVEFCDTADAEGVYRKYSAFRVGGRIIPRHLLVGRGWVLKHPEIVDDREVAEEEAYLRDNPHEAQLAAIFERANIDYGRIDYSLLDGRVVTWEINTNPVITVEPAKLAPARLPGQARFAQQLHEALAAIDRPSEGRSIPFHVPGELKRRLGLRRRDRVMRYAGIVLRRLSMRAPWRQLLEQAD
jgi:hypothetical protein